MTITLVGILDENVGTELGARLFPSSDHDGQVGADVVLSRDDNRTNLYTSGALSDVTVSTTYTADLYLTDGAGTLTDYLTTVSVYVGEDGGQYVFGNTASAERAEILDAITVRAGGTVNISAANYGQDGETLRLKRGSKETLTFDLDNAVTMSDVLMGIYDNTRSLMKLVGTKNTPTQLVFDITASDALRLYEGNHNFDVFEVEGYNSDTGAFSDAKLVVTSDVIVDPLFLRLENE